MAPKKRPKGMLGRVNFGELMAEIASTSSSSSTPTPARTPMPTSMPTPRFTPAPRPQRPPLPEPVLVPLPPGPDLHPLGVRDDAPVILPTKRGSMELALQSSLTTEARTEAMDSLIRDMYSASSKKPRASHARAWEKMHVAWYGPDTPQFPLTPEKLLAVAALFKAGRYRSISNPLSQAKAAHIELGGRWTEQLALVAKRIDRSITRGIGPASQCRSVDLWEICLLSDPDELNSSGPLGPTNMIVGCSFFILREIEISLALWKSISFDTTKHTVTWMLAASKCDFKALGKVRTWGCVCSEADGNEPCPYHALRAQRQLVEDTLGMTGSELDACPVFPTRDGSVCDKTQVVRIFRAIGILLGLTPEVADEISGHLCRVSGAQHLARLGFDIVLIKLMARWDSMVVLRYIAEAPLGTITESYRRLAAGRSMATQLDELLTEVSALRIQVNAMKPQAITAQLEEVELSTPPPVPLSDDAFTGNFLVNNASGKYHLPFVDRTGTTVPYKAKCGWRFTDSENSTASRLTKTDYTLICGVCLPKQRKAARLTVQIVEPAAPDHCSSDSSDSSCSPV